MAAKKNQKNVPNSAKSLDSFPRTTDIPHQTPVHWVLNKDAYLRQLLISDIESSLKCQIFVWHTNDEMRPIINHDDQIYINDLLERSDPELPLYLLIENKGGITEATEGIVSTLHSRFPKFKTIIPNMAKSNGALLALASTEILMGCNSELGPIDPKVHNIASAILRDPDYKQRDPQLHAEGHYAHNHSELLAKKYLKQNMFSDMDEDQAIKNSDHVVKQMLDREVYPSHGAVINCSEAEDMGLSVKYLEPDSKLWKQIWLLHCMYWHDARNCGYSKIFESSKVSRVVEPSGV